MCGYRRLELPILSVKFEMQFHHYRTNNIVHRDPALQQPGVIMLGRIMKITQ